LSAGADAWQFSRSDPRIVRASVGERGGIASAMTDDEAPPMVGHYRIGSNEAMKREQQMDLDDLIRRMSGDLRLEDLEEIAGGLEHRPRRKHQKLSRLQHKRHHRAS
jgi:hypothetical protein